MTFRLAARTALLAFLPLLAPAAPATTVDTLTTPDVLMTVNGRAYTVRPVEIMLSAAKSTRAEATLPQMLDSLVDNQLIAARALKEYTKKELFGDTHVGFPTQVILEDQYSTLLRTYFHPQLDAAVKAQPGGNLDGLIVKRIPDGDPTLKELMTLRDMGEVRYTPKQEALAKKTVVAEYRMPDGSGGKLTMGDLYARMTVQNRVRLIQEHDLAFFDAQIKNRLDSLFVNWWVAAKSGLTKADQALIRTMLEEKYLKQQYMIETGVTTEMHEDRTPTLEKLEKQVTTAEIRDWYAKNKEEFRQIERVRARHIECRTEEDCNTARAAVEKGMEFSAAAKQYSIAEDRNANPPGSLGWIERKDNKLGWLGEVAMIGKQGDLMRPIRSPADDKGNAVWEVVMVDERVEGYNPVDSDTVRYQARGEIARRKAVERFKAAHEHDLATADIRRNAALIQARSGTTP